MDRLSEKVGMLASVSYDVHFSVEVETNPGEIVCIVGNCTELGNWEPQKATQLQRKTKVEASQGESTSAENSGKGDIWSKTVVFSGSKDKKYRYFIGRLLHPDNEEDDMTVIVTKWETNIQPRTFSITDAAKGQEKADVAQFGHYGGSSLVSKGWLIEQSHISLNIHRNPIKMWNLKHKNQLHSVKCTALDHKYAHDDDEGSSQIPTEHSVVTVSVLEKGRSLQQPQGKFGAIYTPDCYMSFNIQSTDPEHTGFQLDFYEHVSGGEDSHKDDPPRHIGYSYILPLDLEQSRGSKKVPISGLKHKPIGELKFDYLLVKPLLGKKFDMSVSYQNFWKSSRRALDIGHRGLGISHSSLSPNTKAAPVTENSIQSMMDAANHGADYVEMDVMLTKDKEVVVFHNFQVNISYKMKQDGELELLTIPLHELKLSELQKMKVWHSTDLDNDNAWKDDLGAENEQPFPTLQRCFESVDLHTGFQIEIKYPQGFTDGQHEQKHFTELNEFLDKILHVVLKYHGGRRIIFSCFDPDVCIALTLKQNRYPVLFLTQADTSVYTHYEGIRTQSVKIAAEFCLCFGLLGVNAMSDVLLKDDTLIQYVKDSGLVLFCWGEDNNDSDIINMLKQKQLDGIIYDRIDHFKTSGKESIFKMEKKGKLVLYEKYGHTENEYPN